MSARSSPSRVVIVGAGAAGLMAAVWAARRARTATRPIEIVLVERTRDGGRKILISGGGRCNVLPSRSEPERFVTDSSPNTLRKILRSWPLDDQRAFFERDLGLRLVLEEATGKLFPDTGHAKDVRDALVAHARREGAQFVPRRRVLGVEPTPSGWSVRSDDAEPIPCGAVVIATGGLSVPSTGSDGFGLALARELGHVVVSPYPALTPLLGGDAALHALSGLSATVTLCARTSPRRIETRGGFLFTHRGFSGPTVLDLSHHVVRSSSALHVRWTRAPEEEIDHELRGAGTGTVLGIVRRHVPERLAHRLLAEAHIDIAMRLADLRKEQRRQLVEALVRWPLPASGHEGYRKAEVTGGGVQLAEVDPRTLQSRRHRGLYFCGEVLDAFGPIGGHNFAWAWATGRAAGEASVDGLARPT